MRQFKTVFKFEYSNYVKSKSFIVITAIMLLIVLIAGNIPVISNTYKNITGTSDSSDSSDSDGDDKKTKAAVLILAPSGVYTTDILSTYFPQYEWSFVDNLSNIEERISSNEFDIALSIDGMSFTLYQRGAEAMFSSRSGFAEMIKDIHQQTVLSDKGLTPDEISGILYSSPEATYISVGKDVSQSFWIGYIMLFMLYFCTIMYGQYVSSSVITEKTSKAMELLITSAKPIHLIFGKVIGTGFAGLTQFGLFSAVAFLTLKLNAAGWQEISPMVGAIVDMSLSSGMFLYAILFFLLGFFMFAFVYAAVSSTVSRPEDASSVVMIPTLLFVAAFMVAMTGMSTPDLTYVKICSFVPFLSPMVMFMRICVADVPFFQVIIGIALNLFYVFAIGFASTKIYRVGVMLYGTTPKIKDLLKYLRQA